MSCWSVLQIEPTADKKAIKKAYAVLLKSNKPDENPKGFAALHEAYKSCLQQAQYMDKASPTQSVPVTPVKATKKQDDLTPDLPLEQNESVSETAVVLEHQEAEPDQVPVAKPTAMPVHIEHVNPSPEEEIDADATQDFFQGWDTAWEQILKDTEDALVSLLRDDDEFRWQFLEYCQELYDFEFKQKYSFYLFNALLQFFNENDRVTPENRINCLRYIDYHLNWSEMLQDLEEEFGEEAVTHVLYPLVSSQSVGPKKIVWTVPKIHPGPIELASYSNRFMAKILDLLLLFFFMIPAEKIGKSNGSETDAFIATFFIYLGVVAILEASPMQGSVGKVLLGIKVSDKNGKRLNIFHSFFRQFIFVINLIAIKVVIWINALFMRGGYLFHDNLSFSRIIKRH